MAGTVKGKVECLFAAGIAENSCQECFVSLYNFLKDLETALYCSEHASWYGVSGTGMAYHDVANPAKSNAWAVFKFPAFGARTFDFYIHIQWNDGSSAVYGNAAEGGAPATIDSGVGQSGGTVGIQMALGLAANGTTPIDPWNGTTVGGGADTKGTPVWVPGAGSVHAFPRSNNAGGDHATNRENHARLFQLTNGQDATSGRFSFVADRDSLFIMGDGNNNAVEDYILYLGAFTPKAGSTYNNPAVMVVQAASLLPLNPNVLYGPLSGGTVTNGGVLGPDVTAGVKSLTVDRLEFWDNIDRHPTNVNGFSGFDSEDIVLNMFEPPYIGRVGHISLFNDIYNTGNRDTNTALSLAVFGTSTVAATKILMEWDSTTTPGTGATRAGVNF